MPVESWHPRGADGAFRLGPAGSAGLDGYSRIGNGALEEENMNHKRTMTDELAGDGSEFHFAEAERLGLTPVVKPLEDVLAELHPSSMTAL